jgi:hypothetical protein
VTGVALGKILVYALAALGALICCFNIYCVLIRFPLHNLMGWEYKWVSGIALFGSGLLVLAISVSAFRDRPFLFWSAITLAILDTGGLHWFLGVMFWMWLFHRNDRA